MERSPYFVRTELCRVRHGWGLTYRPIWSWKFLRMTIAHQPKYLAKGMSRKVVTMLGELWDLQHQMCKDWYTVEGGKSLLNSDSDKEATYDPQKLLLEEDLFILSGLIEGPLWRHWRRKFDKPIFVLDTNSIKPLTLDPSSRQSWKRGGELMVLKTYLVFNRHVYSSSKIKDFSLFVNLSMSTWRKQVL